MRHTAKRPFLKSAGRLLGELIAAGAVVLVACLHAAAQEKAPPETLPANVEKFLVKTSSPLNREAPFYVRRPAGYSGPVKGRLHRVLVIVPFFNGDGLKRVTGSSPLLKLADEREWFVVAPTFKQDKADVRNRSLSYYYPEKWSGRAVLDALEIIRQKHPIATDGLFMQGLSGGAQFAHRFAIWAPERVTAVAVNSSSWFDAPDEKSCQTAWLVTIGDSDPSYENSLRFVDQLRKAGAAPVFRSYLGMVHEGSAAADALDAAFLACYDDLTRSRLGAPKSLLVRKPQPPLPAADMPYAGDAQDWRFGKNEPSRVEEIPEESRVYLPDKKLAELWGRQADEGKE